jgi:7-carboxy-7-deazaguanine synthase
MRLVETLVTLQGEGIDTGRRCLLVRAAGCNLRCHYCDSRYALGQGRETPAAEVLRLAEAAGIPRVCVTGGEPLLQRDLPTVLETLLAGGYQVTVETNGTLPVTRLPSGVAKVMDVKTPGSGYPGSFCEPNLSSMGPGDQYKFVLLDRRDYMWACERMRRWHLGSSGEEVLMSPVHGVLDPGTLADWIIADGTPARLQVQLHKYLWPGQRR